tara:strand:- start:403 stop:645 length:243 start_codon:yes stop_codon:yes gene_type:complete
MSDQDIILKFIRENYNNKNITLNTNLINDTVDSYGIVELGSFLETKFNIEIPDEEFTANNFENVLTILNLIKKLKNNFND